MSPGTVQAAMRALDRGEPRDLEVVFGRARDAGASLDELVCELLVPVQADVGRRWAVDEWSPSEEHRASTVVAGLLMLLEGDLDESDGARVVVCCAAGEVHTLAARMIALMLAARELRVTLVDGTTAPEDLRALLEREQPVALALSCSQAARLPGARRSARAAHAAGVPVLMGGRGTGTDGRRVHPIGADAWASGADDASEVIRGWMDAPPALTDPASDAEAEELRGDTDLPRVVVSGSANGFLIGDAAALQWARWQLEGLVEHLVIAVEVHDPGVMIEHADWLRRVLGSRGHDRRAVPAALDDLAAGLRHGLGRAADIVGAARAAMP